jgi:hypothetical protein
MSDEFNFSPSIGDAAVKAILDETGVKVAIIVVALPIVDHGDGTYCLDAPGMVTNMPTREQVSQTLDNVAKWYRESQLNHEGSDRLN